MERRVELENQRHMLTAFVQQHYPEIADLAENRANAISDLEALQKIFMQVLVARSREQIAAALAFAP